MTDIKLALIYGSVRKGRFCDTIAAWTKNEIERFGGFSVDTLDPLALDLPGLASRTQDAGALKRTLGAAEAFVVVTPEYNHGYPAALKGLIDSAGAEWRAKPVAFVSYGGVSGGLRAVEQLRQVFAELRAVTIRDTVSFAKAWTLFDATGRLSEPDEPGAAAATMLADLAWWATVLKDARNAPVRIRPAA